MRNLIKNNYDLFLLCNYKALLTVRNYLLSCFTIMSFYFGYYRITLIPFYLLILLVILPSLLHNAFKENTKVADYFPQLSTRMGYCAKKQKSLRSVFYLILVMLFLWYLRWQTLSNIATWNRLLPSILIISSLVIYTIGQYYYFVRFHKAMMEHSIENLF